MGYEWSTGEVQTIKQRIQEMERQLETLKDDIDELRFPTKEGE